jgi:hypothetical protein
MESEGQQGSIALEALRETKDIESRKKRRKHNGTEIF